MTKLFLIIFLSLAGAAVFAQNSDLPEGMSKADYDTYLAGCKKMILDANPKRNAKDVDMLCSDPYLNGKPNESKEDKSRRKRLLKETNNEKNKALGKFVDSKETKKTSDVPEGMSKSEFDSYLKGCKKLILEAHPKKDPKDVDMLCRDPYLNGKPNESKEDLARRQRLLAETNQAKAQALEKFVVPNGNSQSPEVMSKDEYLRDCKKMILEQDPGKDPKDADMLCGNPYLKGQPNESADDQARRKRLIRETDQAKEKALDKYVVPPPAAPAAGAR